MKGKYVAFVNPEDTVVTLTPDGGAAFVGVPGTSAGRPAVIVTIDRDTPDGHGASLELKSGPDVDTYHAVLRMSHLNPVTGSVSLEIDTFTVRKAGSGPFVGESGFLEVRGTRLFREDGSPYTVIGCSDFALLERLLRGEDVWPIVEERRALGFTRFRVFGMYSPASFVGGGRGLRPQDYGEAYWERAAHLIDEIGRMGGRVGVTLFASSDTVMPDRAAQLDYFHRWDALLASRWNADLELVNEQGLYDNGVDQVHFPRPATRIASRGSGGQGDTAVTPVWSVAQIHTGRAEAWPRKSAHNPKEDAEDPFGVPSWSDEPTGAAETLQPWRRDNRPVRFRDAGAGGALLTAGTTFHSDAGKDSYLFPPVQLECATAFVAGARAVDLRFRGGSYSAGHLHDIPIEHRDDWSSRTYARILGNEACAVVIDRTPSWQLILKNGWTLVGESHGVLTLAR